MPHAKFRADPLKAVAVHKARSTLATMSKQHCRSNRQLCCLLLRQCCRFGQHCRNNVRLCRKDEISTQTSFGIVAVFGNKMERCFDIVAGVDRVLVIVIIYVLKSCQKATIQYIK